MGCLEGKALKGGSVTPTALGTRRFKGRAWPQLCVVPLQHLVWVAQAQSKRSASLHQCCGLVAQVRRVGVSAEEWLSDRPGTHSGHREGAEKGVQGEGRAHRPQQGVSPCVWESCLLARARKGGAPGARWLLLAESLGADPGRGQRVEARSLRGGHGEVGDAGITSSYTWY